MSQFEYKTIAAPRRVKRIKGVKGREAQLAQAIEDIIREQARTGWEYHRADTFQTEESGGFFSKAMTVDRTIMVFRRATGAGAPVRHERVEAVAAQPHYAPAPEPAPVAAPQSAPPVAAPAATSAESPAPKPVGPVPNERGFSIAGVEPPKSASVGGVRKD